MIASLQKDPIFVDITCQDNDKLVSMEIQDRGDKKVMYIHIDGITVFRMCNIQEFEIEYPNQIPVAQSLTAPINREPVQPSRSRNPYDSYYDNTRED